MSSNETKHETHDVRNTTAISGAVVGATAGILGGIAGIGTAGLIGAVIGALGGLALERDLANAAQRRAEDEELEGLTRAEAEAAVGIEPPCEDCLAVREASAGTTMWCARHGSHHVHARLHYEYPPSAAMGSLLIRPAA